MKPVLIAVAVALALTGCATSSNTTACKLYADSFNQMADMAQLKNSGDAGVTSEMVRAEDSMIPSRIKDAFDKASGDVAVEIRASYELALAKDGSEDAGVAYFMSTSSVQKACAADGASFDLHPLK